jgi:hypothetical protein
MPRHLKPKAADARRTAPSRLPTTPAAPVGPAVEPQPHARPTEVHRVSPPAPVGPAVSPQPAPKSLDRHRGKAQGA